MRARRVVVENQGHTYYEVWYKGDDGVEQWHSFDPFIGWYVLNENGEVASVEQMARNPQLIQNPYPGHPEPMGHHPDRSGMGHRTALRTNLSSTSRCGSARTVESAQRHAGKPQVLPGGHRSVALYPKCRAGRNGGRPACDGHTAISPRSAALAIASRPKTSPTGRTTCGQRTDLGTSTRAGRSAGTARG